MCVDYTDLNKACPKDSFPLPRIDSLVDATAGHQLLTFMDAFSGYNQIRMAPQDKEKTAFVTSKGLYCYRMMPFGLKNAGATYQRLVNRVFKEQIGKNMEVYVDDMLVKSTEASHHMADLGEAFRALRQYQIKLNPAKCVFGVTSGKFLGFIVTQRGIEANPDKIQAIQSMAPPASVKDVQRLAGRVASLGRFVAKSAERCRPFFKTLKHPKDFRWTGECQEAFDQLKQYLVSPPLLSKPQQGERLYLYMAVSPVAVSSVLVREDHGVQKPVYYTSRILRDAETRYPKMEKTIYALILTARRLRPYFQAHPIAVYTDLPVRRILQGPEGAGRMVKWAVELSEFDIAYLPRPSIKAQVLADFLVESTIPEEPEPGEVGAPSPPWTLHVDGSSCPKGGGAGLVLTSPDGDVAEYALRFGFPASNNEAEYEALLAGMRLAKQLGVKHLQALTDSQLVAEQVRGEYETRSPAMNKYLAKVKALASSFTEFVVRQVPRSENTRADRLSKLATAPADKFARATYFESLENPSIAEPEAVLTVDVEPCWMDPLIAFLKEGVLPGDESEARRLTKKAARYAIYEGRLYRTSYSSPLLRCLRPSEAAYALEETHEGECGSHAGGRTLAHKILRQGYYWPTLQEDASDFVRRCDACQRHSHIQRRPGARLAPIPAPWPFAQWGMDILGPFPVTTGQRKFLIVAIDYFTKWVEAEPLATITEAQVRKFVKRNIFCRFGVPHTLITDNGRQFDNAMFRDFCEEYGIEHRFTAVAHPQTNGAAEVTNRTILQGLKARVARTGGTWADQLYSVLWAYRTTQRTPTGETPFSLAYGTEAVVPLEIGLPSLRVAYFEAEPNDEKLRGDLDLLEETREAARVRMAIYQRKVARYYNARVRAKLFRVGDLVLRRAEVSLPTERGKLAPNWEGPYRVREVNRPGSYKLEALDGRVIPRSWNSDNLRVYHP